MSVINANSVDPYQTLYSAASDLGLHCLPMSNIWDARHALNISFKQHNMSFKRFEIEWK